MTWYNPSKTFASSFALHDVGQIYTNYQNHICRRHIPAVKTTILSKYSFHNTGKEVYASISEMNSKNVNKS